MVRLRTILLMLLFSPLLFAEETASETAVAEEAAAAGVEEKKEKPVYEQTPEEMELYNAAREGRLEKLRLLIANGINIDMQNKQGRTPLMVATYKRNHGVIRELLAEGADIEIKDGKGKTALILAVMAQDDRMIQKLIALGVDKTTQDDSERTAEDYALLTNNPRIITVFRPEPDCEEGDEECLAAAEAAKVAQAETAGEGTEAAGNKEATKTN